MDDLARKRAEKQGDSRLWTALDALEDTIERIKSGDLAPDCISIQMLSAPDVNGNRAHTYVAAGVSYESHIALLHVALQRTVDDWIS